MIWRDDDVGANTRLEDLAAVDDLFQRYRVPHTIAVMACGMDTRPDLVDLIAKRRMIVQLHCWNHDDLAESARGRRQLVQAVELLQALFGKPPTVLYPTWNRTSPELEAAAAALGLAVSCEKVSLEQFIRCEGDVVEPVCNFHYWSVSDALQIEPALRIARARPAPLRRVTVNG
jgi:peptidoglycan/xylan/chitin deacetylase (PgdA/CDA1 family)